MARHARRHRAARRAVNGPSGPTKPAEAGSRPLTAPRRACAPGNRPRGPRVAYRGCRAHPHLPTSRAEQRSAPTPSRAIPPPPLRPQRASARFRAQYSGPSSRRLEPRMAYRGWRTRHTPPQHATGPNAEPQTARLGPPSPPRRAHGLSPRRGAPVHPATVLADRGWRTADAAPTLTCPPPGPNSVRPLHLHAPSPRPRYVPSAPRRASEPSTLGHPAAGLSRGWRTAGGVPRMAAVGGSRAHARSRAERCSAPTPPHATHPPDRATDPQPRRGFHLS